MDEKNIYDLAATLDLSQVDVDAILTQPAPVQPNLSLGGPFYSGTYYGAFSIRDYPD